MTDFPDPRVLPLSITSIGDYGPGSEGVMEGNLGLGASGTATANRIYYLPIALPFAYPAKQWVWGNGSSANANAEAGLYDHNGNLLRTSGSVAQSGASAAQFSSVNMPFLIPRGKYYLAIVFDASTNKCWNHALGGSTLQGREMGCLIEDGAGGLPATWTPAQYASAVFPLVGVVRY